MNAFLAVFTWERFLVVWGLIAPAITWLVTRRWESKNRLEIWNHENELRKEQVSMEEKRRQEERERAEVQQLRERMRDSYTRFLAGASAITLAVDLGPNERRTQAFTDCLPDFALSFQQLLLVASTHSARPAVEVWNRIAQLTQLSQDDAALPELKEALRKARSRFVSEAREDLNDPLVRNSNPGITIEPAVSIGGFDLEDAG